MKHINDLSIRTKFILLYLLGVLLPICILLTYVLTNTTAEVRKREQMNAQQSLDRVCSTLETQFSSAVALSNAVSVDVELLSLVRHTYDLPWKYYASYYDAIRPMMVRYLSAFSQQVYNMEVYSTNKTVFSGGYCLSLESARNESWMPDNLTGSGIRIVSYLRQTPNITPTAQMSLIRTVTDTRYPPIVLKIDLLMSPIHRVIESETDYLDVYLISPEGYAVIYPGSLLDGMATQREMRPPDNCTLSAAFSDTTAMAGWRLEAVVNEEPMRDNVKRTVFFGILMGALCSVLAGALSLMMSHSVIDRSKRLLRHMDSMTNEHFDSMHHDIGRDEIGELIEHFNAMSERMKQLIQNIYVLELQQKNLELERVRAEFKYLQAQIDPHFLFNTLNAILVLCVRNGYGELTEVIRALSKILRRMIDTSRDVVPLKEELEFVKMALLIEQFRFGDKLSYEIDASADTLECPVPVMCVQSLVENACKHGVQHINRQGIIRIQARIAEDFLSIRVVDNGAGIAPERMRFLQSNVHSSDDIEGSIGLQNIYRRLVLHYGERAELTLDNAPERGTVAGIRIPLDKENA